MSDVQRHYSNDSKQAVYNNSLLNVRPVHVIQNFADDKQLQEYLPKLPDDITLRIILTDVILRSLNGE